MRIQTLPNKLEEIGTSAQRGTKPATMTQYLKKYSSVYNILKFTSLNLNSLVILNNVYFLMNEYIIELIALLLFFQL